MNILTQLQPIFLYIFVYATMIYLGLGMTVKDLGAAFKKPKLLIITLILNIVVSPVLAWLLGWAFGLASGALTAVILINLFGGAPAGPKNVNLAGGDAPLSIALVAVVSIANILVVPFTSQLFLQDVQVDVGEILLNLVILIVIPLAIGLLIRQFLPKAVKALGRIEMLLSNIFMVAVLVAFLIPNLSNIAGAGWTVVLVYLLVIAATFAVSWVVTFGTVTERKTVSLITITKNFGVALSMASLAAFQSQGLVPYMMTYVVVLLVFSLLLSLVLKKAGAKGAGAQAAPAKK